MLQVNCRFWKPFYQLRILCVDLTTAQLFVRCLSESVVGKYKSDALLIPNNPSRIITNWLVVSKSVTVAKNDTGNFVVAYTAGKHKREWDSRTLSLMTQLMKWRSLWGSLWRTFRMMYKATANWRSILSKLMSIQSPKPIRRRQAGPWWKICSPWADRNASDFHSKIFIMFIAFLFFVINAGAFILPAKIEYIDKIQTTCY